MSAQIGRRVCVRAADRRSPSIVHHQNILGRNGAIGLQLETPVPFSVLRAEKRARSTLYGVLELG